MTKEITSKSNDFIKYLLKLKQKRHCSDEILIEGERFVNEAVKRGIKIKTLLYTEAPKFIHLVKAQSYQISPQVAKALSSTVTPSGIFALINYNASAFGMPRGDFLVLDHISDPGNLGTIIRTALAFGFKDIYLYQCADWRNPKVLRSTMGTIFDVRLYEIGYAEIIELAKLPLFKADIIGTNINTFTRNLDILGIILGNEANGISEDVDTLIKSSLSIPMKNAVESLNVAIAGAILMSKLTK